MRFGAPAVWLAVLAVAALAACTNGGGLGSIGGGGGGSPSPPPSTGIGLGVPDRKIGVEDDPVWGSVGGYTQDKTSQVLAFPPGSSITLTNLSSTDLHTLNVIATTSGPPPAWPRSPNLGFYPAGNGKLGSGYASGTINPGASVTVKLSKPGTYLIGCAFHYIELSMRDVIQVVAGATPGPTASPGPGGYAVPLPHPIKKHSAPAQHPRLVDQQHRAFTFESLRGKPLAVTFVAAHCTDACPLINAQFGEAAKRIAQVRLDARLVTITLDPEHDSLADMRAIATRFQADPRYWLVAGGAKSDVFAVMREFGVLSVAGKRGYRDEHTTYVYILDRNGRLARTMLASSALSDAVVEALRAQQVPQR